MNKTIVTLNGDDDNGKRYYCVDKILAEDDLIIPYGSNIIFAVDSEVRLKPRFHAVNGSRFHAKSGCKFKAFINDGTTRGFYGN